MHSADYAVARCPSVRLSHAGILSKQLNISSTVFNQRVAPPFEFFKIKTRWQYSDSDSNPITGASNARWVWKKSRFSTNVSLYLGNYAVTMDGEYETAPKLSNVTSLNYLEWPLTSISRSWYYSMSNNWKMVQDRAIPLMADQ